MEGRGPPHRLDVRQARVWNFLCQSAWFFDIRMWPAYLQEIMLSNHRRNRERYTLFFFFVANGLDPELAGRWTLMHDYTRGNGPIAHGYDGSAFRHVDQMRNDVANNTFFQGRKKMIDLATGRVITQ